MKDKFYMFWYRRSVMKYDIKTTMALYEETRRSFLSGRYSGVAQHKLYLQLKVLRERVNEYVNSKQK